MVFGSDTASAGSGGFVGSLVFGLIGLDATNTIGLDHLRYCWCSAGHRPGAGSAEVKILRTPCTPALTILTLLATQTFGQQNMGGHFRRCGHLAVFTEERSCTLLNSTIAFQSSNYYNRWSASGVGFQTQLTVGGGDHGRCEERIRAGKSGGFHGPEYQFNFTHLGLSLGAAYRTSRRFHGVVSFGVLPSFIVSASSLSRSYYPVPNKEISTGIGVK